jgi:hypothetical protein
VGLAACERDRSNPSMGEPGEAGALFLKQKPSQRYTDCLKIYSKKKRKVILIIIIEGGLRDITQAAHDLQDMMAAWALMLEYSQYSLARNSR